MLFIFLKYFFYVDQQCENISLRHNQSHTIKHQYRYNIYVLQIQF